jgi:hypothetical protein
MQAALERRYHAAPHVVTLAPLALVESRRERASVVVCRLGDSELESWQRVAVTYTPACAIPGA